MKNIILSLGFLTTIACSHASMGNDDRRLNEVDREASDTSSPTPNTGYNRTTINDATQQDPKGNLAPMLPCRRGKVERRESGKIVCVPADRTNPNNTMTGR